ncbi:MAG TPA: hypothetical protein VLC50_03185, partial [Actinomycetes bacterium]|nr:hypothetical protein [Actinomycetes bacterium]
MSLDALLDRARTAARPRVTGQVRGVLGLTVTVGGVDAAVGDLVEVATPHGVLATEVVAVDPDGLSCTPLGELTGVRVGAEAHAVGGALTVPVGEALRGRVLDGLGRPIDGGSSLSALPRVPVEQRVQTHAAAPASPQSTARTRASAGPSWASTRVASHSASAPDR